MQLTELLPMQLPNRQPCFPAFARLSRGGEVRLRELHDLVDLGQALRKKDLNTASFLLDSGEKGKAPSSPRQASRKALLLADGLLISANSGSRGREVLVARYYINEFHYATERIAEILSADDVDWPAAAELWRLGADSYNSFFVCVNKAIVPKVGEKFAAVRV